MVSGIILAIVVVRLFAVAYPAQDKVTAHRKYRLNRTN